MMVKRWSNDGRTVDGMPMEKRRVMLVGGVSERVWMRLGLVLGRVQEGRWRDDGRVGERGCWRKYFFVYCFYFVSLPLYLSGHKDVNNL